MPKHIRDAFVFLEPQQEGQDGPVSLSWLSDKLAFRLRRKSAK